MQLEGKRLADEKVYLREDWRGKEPKLIFKMIGERIEGEGVSKQSRLCDVGCATGEMLNYLMERFPGLEINGIDISNALLNAARARNPGGNFKQGSVLNSSDFSEREFDIVVATGLLSIVDDPSLFLNNLLSITREKGIILISSSFNSDPIDTITRYRRVNDTVGDWETGWNIWSTATINRHLSSVDYDLYWDWTPWDPPYPTQKSEDIMRTWTIKTEEKERQKINGASLLLNAQLLAINVKSVTRPESR